MQSADKWTTCTNCGEAVRVPAKTPVTTIVPRPASEDPAEDFFREVQQQPIGERSRNTLTIQPIANSGPIQITVQQPSRAAHSLGIASVILGILAFLICWIPLVGAIGMPLGALGLVLGTLGVLVALFRRGSGIGFAIAGSAICAVAVFVAFTVNLTIAGALAEAFIIRLLGAYCQIRSALTPGPKVRPATRTSTNMQTTCGNGEGFSNSKPCPPRANRIRQDRQVVAR
jgi:hypothetical protein